MALVEVKIEAEVRLRQIVRYRQLLADSGVANTALILLTRYPVIFGNAEAKPDGTVRWFHVAESLRSEKGAHQFRSVSNYLSEQFLAFLEVRGMVMAQVTWDLASGVRALRTLSDMLYEVAVACGVQAQQAGGRDYHGVNLNNRDYRVGLYFDRPHFVVFETNYRPVDDAVAARLGIAGVYERKATVGRHHAWRRELNLEAEDVHFFARSPARQIQLLEKFVRESLDLVRQIEIAAPLPAVEDTDLSEE